MHQNIESILAFYSREEQKISRAQRVLEHLGNYLEQPLYPLAIIFMAAVWIVANELAPVFDLEPLDPAPYFWLQGIVSLGALLTTTVVLIKQRRLARLAEQRAHLDLQVNLLTEQKATKLIQLLEELRRDLPMVRNRHDPEAHAMQQPTDPEEMLAAIDEHAAPEAPPPKAPEP